MTPLRLPLSVRPSLSRLGAWATACVVGVLAHSTQAQLVFDSASATLLPNQANQSVDFFVQNLGPDPVRFSGLIFNLQVADSGPASEGGLGSLDAPNITGVDLLTGTLLANTLSAPVDLGSVAQFASWSWVTAGEELSLDAGVTRKIATILFDTTGFLGGEWDLSFAETINGPTEVLRIDGLNVVETPVTRGTGRLRILNESPHVPDLSPTLALLALGLVPLGWTRRQPAPSAPKVPSPEST